MHYVRIILSLPCPRVTFYYVYVVKRSKTSTFTTFLQNVVNGTYTRLHTLISYVLLLQYMQEKKGSQVITYNIRICTLPPFFSSSLKVSISLCMAARVHFCRLSSPPTVDCSVIIVLPSKGSSFPAATLRALYNCGSA